MDDFGLDKPDLTGSLISMEFGQGGRIQQLWVADPNQPEGEEFQFVCSPITMGDEFSEDYFPGTIMLGARTAPDDPWIVSRNASARMIHEEDDGAVAFEYDFSFLEDIRATGRFYEIPGYTPQICWEVRLVNTSRRSIEIGELAFPFALNNVYEAYPRTDKGLQEMWNDRVYVHKSIGSGASYLFGQRMTGRPPGLLIFPGDDTKWEFYNHVIGSLNTPYRWEGIPVVYIHSRAAVEREGWGEWFLGHSSMVLEPGEERVYQTRFASADRDIYDNVSSVLVACNKAAIRLFPAAVAPAEVGIAVEVGGVTPARFTTDVEAEIETDADEDGGFCFVRPAEPGPVRLSFESTNGAESDAHLLFIEPIAELIQRRAEWIMENQIVRDGPMESAILPADNTSGSTLTPYGSEFAVDGCLSDALFLAEKNTIYPDSAQVEALDQFVEDVFERILRNPADGSVGSYIPNERSVAAGYGKPQTYALSWCFYQSMARVARSYGGTTHDGDHYLRAAGETAVTMFDDAAFPAPLGIGVPLMSYLPSLISDLQEAGHEDLAGRLSTLSRRRDREVARRRYPSAGDTLFHTVGYEEAFFAALRRQDSDAIERILRCAYAARSLSPSWWWYGSDKSWSEMPLGTPNPAIEDKGEICLGGTTVANSLMLLEMLDRDVPRIPETYLRMAFGGLLGVWALVRSDGAASQGYCPDAASKQFGMSWVTGDIGTSLFHYLRRAYSLVLPQQGAGLLTFACHLEADTEGDKEAYAVRPWDGVGRRIVLRQIGFEVATEVGQIVELRLDSDKRKAVLVLQNTADRELNGKLDVKGIWSRRLTNLFEEFDAVGGRFQIPVALPAGESVRVELRAIE